MSNGHPSVAASLMEMPPFDPDDALNVIIDTPKASPNKYKLDEQYRLFKLNDVLTAGARFPFDFGYVPSTRGPDGDPVDVLVLMDEPVFVGCWIACRLIGVIEAEQNEEGGKMVRNDRLVAVAAGSARHASVKELADLPKELLEEIEHFFKFYNEAKGKRFKVLGRRAAKKARKMVEQSARKG